MGTTYYQKNFVMPADLATWLNSHTVTGIDGIIPAWGKQILLIYHVTTT